MRIVSWNVAGFRAVLKKGFEDFFNSNNADVFCLQEVKALAEQITFHPEGYTLYLNPAEKKGYSGTAIYTRIEPLSVSYGIGIKEHDHEGRVITMEFADFYLVNVYVPNVKRELTRLDYRMKWEDDFRGYLKTLRDSKPVICCGDMNVAHQEIDIKNAKANGTWNGIDYTKGFVLCEDKNTQQFKIEVYDFDVELIKPFVQRCKDIKQAYITVKEQNVMVPRPSDAQSVDCKRCYQCPMRDACWRGKREKLNIKK